MEGDVCVTPNLTSPHATPRLGAAAAIGHGGFVTLPFFSCFSVKVPLFFAHQKKRTRNQPFCNPNETEEHFEGFLNSPLLCSLLTCFVFE